jgi:hypothetical protein
MFGLGKKKGDVSGFKPGKKKAPKKLEPTFPRDAEAPKKPKKLPKGVEGHRIVDGKWKSK